jgi:hypothetical protein
MAKNERALVNRNNSAKSTGPRTVAGKARSRLNATRHGLRSLAPVLPGERAKDWQEHRAGVVASLSPVGRLEEELAERAAFCLWRMRRVAAFEVGVIGVEVVDVTDAPAKEKADDPLDALFTPRPSAIGDARKALESQRQTVRSWRGTHELFQRLPGLPDDAPLDGEDVWGLLLGVNGELPNAEEVYFDFQAEDVLSALGVPKDAGDDLESWEGWTAGKVRQAVGLAAAEFEDAAERLLSAAAADTAAGLAESVEEEARLEEEVRKHERREARGRERKACHALMPDARTLDKLMRYESHIGRQFVQALHTLERLQKARAGQDVPAPQALDVTLDAGA